MICPARQTLRTIFESEYLSAHCLEPRTAQRVRHDLNAWERLTDDPDVRQIDRHWLELFRDRGLVNHSRATVKGQLGTVLTLLNYCGPPCRSQPDALELLDRVPFIRLPKTHPDPKPAASLDALALLYRHAEAATWPKMPGVEPGAYWRAWFVTAFCTGLRRRDLFQTLRWSHLDTSESEPAIRIRAHKSRKLHVIPAHPALIDHVGRIRTAPKDGRIFPSPACYEKQARHTLQRIAAAAGICAVTPQQIRRRAAIEFEKAHPGAGLLIQGSMIPGARVTFESYIPIPEVLRLAVRKLPRFWTWETSTEPPPF